MRLGLPRAGGFDQRLTEAVRAYQQVHGLGPADGIAGRATIASLNRGATYYARKIAINMERAHRLPKAGQFDRYVVVDSGAAEVYLFDRDRAVDETGGQMAVFGRVGSRPFTRPEMEKLFLNSKGLVYKVSDTVDQTAWRPPLAYPN